VIDNHALFARLVELGLRPKRCGDVIRSRCPTHDSNSDSLCSRVSNGRLLVHCHVGCHWSILLPAIGLKSDTVQVPFQVLKRAVPEPKRADPSVLEEWAAMCAANDDADVEDHEQQLGIPQGGLRRLGAVWAVGMAALCAPMMDAPGGTLIGVRVRAANGDKYAIKGSCNGLFVPQTFTGSGFLYFPEGFTDSAAMQGLGLDAIGRPSALGGRDLVRAAARRAKRQCVVIGDRDSSDNPAAKGPEVLAQELLEDRLRVRILRPPPGFKDMRRWIAGGATRESIEWAARHRSEL
jgi:hypothetical protein